MAKKHNLSQQETEQLENYYELNTEAVERLVNADTETDAEVGSDQPDPYKAGFLSKIPCWVKALFLKFWFNGAVCFFFLWGLGIYLKNQWDQVLVLGIAMGIITDLLVNNLFRFMQSDDKEYEKWMLLPQKGFWTFFVNVAYALLQMVLVMLIYDGINKLIIAAKNLPADSVPLGVEPFLFGLIYLLLDLAIIGIKDGIIVAVRKARNKKTVEVEPETESLPTPTTEPKPLVVIKQVQGGKKRKKK